jgi:hypothetical protein
MTAYEALNLVCKWRAVFAGWQIGTRPKGDPECDAIRDHRETTIILRVEQTALSKLLVDKGIVTLEELEKAIGDEAVLLNRDYERKFPGITAHARRVADEIERAHLASGEDPAVP